MLMEKEKVHIMSKKDFNEFRFAGLNYKEHSNKYLTMNRVSEDGNKIVVRVADSHLIKTQFGYALVLDRTRVVFIKDWQVSRNWYGNEVLLTRQYFNVKSWEEHEEFVDSDDNLTFDSWLNVAKEQDQKVTEVDEESYEVEYILTPVRWEK